MIPEGLFLDKINLVYKKILPYVNVTPLVKGSDILNEYLGTNIYLKYECFQRGGSFKIRGAINNALSIKKEKLKNGITAVSAGNHAIAASYVANIFNLKNKIFLYESANPFRVEICKKLKANILFTNADKAFENVKAAEKEGYIFIHPFDGLNTLQGSATLGLEIINQINKLNKHIENVIIAVGGGGLISGVGSLIKQIYPNVKIIGVEPLGAKGMTKSLKVKKPLKKVKINSIADSLCAPLHMPYSFSVAKEIIDLMINVSEEEMIHSMIDAYNNLKMILEPACVASIAALNYHLKNDLKNQNTILLLCGSNIDFQTWKKITSY